MSANITYMNETFKERMKRIRIRAGFNSQGQAAEAIGCERGTVSMWEAPSSSVQSVSGDLLFDVGRAYKVNPAWINDLSSDFDGYPWSESQILSESGLSILDRETPPGYFRLNLFEGGGGMGNGIANEDYPEVVRTLEVAEWEIRRKLGFLPKPGRIQIITGRGPSMRPVIEDGDIVWIDTSVSYFDGDDYYLINYQGETQIKMLQKRIDGMYVVSENPKFKEWKCDPEEISIKGKALVHAGFRRF